MRMPSLPQGVRGWLTSKVAEPIDQRSPTTASLTAMPAMVRFSPNVPGSRGRPSSLLHQS